ncbi:MAG: DUF4922 domain-containing protein [Bacteroidaceae bacterium]|nr:DUF4922 domain-containing protein [Bacteroidaceae bacterium]
MKQTLDTLFDEQLRTWELAKTNYAALSQVKMRRIEVDGCSYMIQYNPARIISSAAKVDAQSIKERKCFLCRANRPKEQLSIPFGKHYEILVNPYPIFTRHFTIPEIQHTGQRIAGHFGDMLDLAAFAKEYVVFYNGPKCGASAPDHFHFQAGNKGFLPIEKEWSSNKALRLKSRNHAELSLLTNGNKSTFIIESTNKEETMQLFDDVYLSLPIKSGEDEPMINMLAWIDGNKWVILIFPRYRHRPSCYSAIGDANILLSPASVDMGCTLITPLEKDFNKITAADISTIFQEVCLGPDEINKIKKLIIEKP